MGPTAARIAAPLAALTYLLAAGTADAAPDLVIVSSGEVPVVLEEVRTILCGQLPELEIVTQAGSPRPSGAQVTISRWADGRLAISYRDREGRETVRVVEPGPRPESTVAMIVVNLQADQLGAVLGPVPRPGPPVVVRPAATPHLRARVPSAARREEGLTLAAGLGLMNRNLEVEVTDSDHPRTYSAPGYPVLALEGAVFPGRLLGEGGLLARLGLELAYRRALLLQTSGPTDLGETLDVDATYDDAAITLVFDTALSSAARPPRLRLGAGWSRVAFWLDPLTMVLLREEVQVPSFLYQGWAAFARLDVPIGESGVSAHALVGGHWVTDVGQAVRDLYGSDTRGALGYRVELGVEGTMIPRLHWAAELELRNLTTDIEGVSGADIGYVGAFPSATDRYFVFQLALAYQLDS